MKRRASNLFNIDNVYVRELVNVSIASVVSTALALLCYFIDIPNPNLIYLMAMVASVTLLGPISGVPAYITALVYTLYMYSEDHNFWQYIDGNVTRVIVAYISFTLSYVFLGILSYRRNKRRLKLETSNKELKNQAKTDYLTGIYNRAALVQFMNDNLNNRIHFLIFDIDKYKEFNDTYGHDFGDEVLRRVGDAMIEVFPFNNCFRFGGDEFVIASSSIESKEWKHKIDEFIEELQNIRILDRKVTLTISGGSVNFVAEDMNTVNKNMKTADGLLYQAKRNGRGHIVYMD